MAAEAVAAVLRGGPDMVLMDVRMPNRDGFAACRDLKLDVATRFTPVVLMTGTAEREDRVKAIEAGADDFLTKPIDESELRARVKSLVRLKQLQAHVRLSVGRAKPSRVGLARQPSVRNRRA